MDPRRLETFVAVAHERSFTSAAQLLHLSQSAVSQQIAALERELEAQLFDRRGRRVALTPAGTALLGWSERLLHDAEGARRAVAAAQGRVTGTLAVDASLTIAAYLLPRPLAELVRLYPQLRIALSVENTEHVLRAVAAGRADVGFVEGEGAADGTRVERVFDDELVLVAPPDHRFAHEDEVAPDALLAELFVTREPGSGTRQVAEAALRTAGIDPGRLRVIAEVSGIDAIKAAVEAGIGVAIVSALTVRRELQLGTLVARPLRGLTMRRELAAAFAADQPVLPAAQELVRIVRARTA
jgi:DNA-binding transcriptional LysR family regulator